MGPHRRREGDPVRLRLTLTIEARRGREPAPEPERADPPFIFESPGTLVESAPRGIVTGFTVETPGREQQ